MGWLFPRFITGLGAVGLLGIRLVVGAAFIVHGWPKIQNPLSWMGEEIPGIVQALAAVAEFGGGIALILGLVTPLAALGIACTMVGALAIVHVPARHPFVGKGGSLELPVVYLAISIGLILLGPGILSADACLFGRKPPPPPTA